MASERLSEFWSGTASERIHPSSSTGACRKGQSQTGLAVQAHGIACVIEGERAGVYLDAMLENVGAGSGRKQIKVHKRVLRSTVDLAVLSSLLVVDV